jgi:glycosyltransferase involved in cell wall biosynthesis
MPAVSVILPTYNRARFLDEAFASIVAQTWQDWELIVVDDGSNDETRAVVERWRPRFSKPFTYVWRENGGAYAARNTGLDHATGDFVAFFDSDDLWLPHHLERCASALAANPELDWIFAACRSIDASGNLVQPTTFEMNGRSRLFLSLRTKNVAGLKIINDPKITEYHLAEGLFAGLQNSVIRRRVFDGHRFWEDYRVVEDSLFLARALARRIRLAYFTDIHVIYRIHDANSSGSVAGGSREGLLRIYREHVRGLARLENETAFSAAERAALRRSLALHYFWHIGYVCCWEAGDSVGALEAYRAGLRLTPFDVLKWKTYLSALGRTFLKRQRP